MSGSFLTTKLYIPPTRPNLVSRLRLVERLGMLPFVIYRLILGAALLVFVMWWLYFERSTADLLTSRQRAFEWGYGHLFIWASAAAVGAGIAVGLDVLTDHAHVDMPIAGAAVAIPVAVYLASIWVLHDVPRPQSRLRTSLGPIAIVLVLALMALASLVRARVSDKDG